MCITWIPFYSLNLRRSRNSIVLNPVLGALEQSPNYAWIYGCVPGGRGARKPGAYCVETGGNYADHGGFSRWDDFSGPDFWDEPGPALHNECVLCDPLSTSPTRMLQPAHKRMQTPHATAPCSRRRTLFRPVFSLLHASPLRPPHHTTRMPRSIPTLRVPRTTVY